MVTPNDEVFLKFRLNAMPRISTCGKSTAIDEFVHPERIPDEYILFLGIRGELYYQEADTPLVLHQAETLFLRPHILQKGSGPSRNVEYNWCHFYMDNPVQIVDYADAYEALILMRDRTISNINNLVILPRHLKLTDLGRIITLYNQLFYSSRDRGCYSEEYGNHCLSMLLYELSQQTILAYCSEIPDIPYSNFRFSQILQYINSTLHRQIRIEDLADHFCYSPNYLSQLFKQKTGYSTCEYINRRKMEEASWMLINTDDSLKFIAAKVGFQDYKYFLRVFQKITGETPTQMRNAWMSGGHRHIP